MSLPDLSSSRGEGWATPATARDANASDRPRGVLVRKQQSSIYTSLLLVALVALMFGCLILILEWSHYGFQWKPPANLRTAAAEVQSAGTFV